jgi:hypothetical protein
MSDISEFLTAMQMLQRGMQDMAQTKIIGKATAEMKLANQTIKNDQERFLALQNLSNELAMRLSGAGADPTKVAQTTKAIAPQFQTADEAIFQGVMSGSDQLQKLGSKAKRTQNADELALKNRQLDLQEMGVMADLMSARAKADKGAPFDISAIKSTDNLVNLPKEALERHVPGFRFVAGTKDDAKTVKKELKDAKGAEASLDKLISYAQKATVTGKLTDWTKNAEVGQLTRMLQAQLRPFIAGPGVASDQDTERLKEVIIDPSKFLSYASQNKLQVLKDSFTKKKNAVLETYGVTPYADRRQAQAEATTSGGVQLSQSQIKKLQDLIAQNPNDKRAVQAQMLLQNAGVK